MRRLCYVCKKRPAKRMQTKIGYARVLCLESYFCSMWCAADWALLMAETSVEDTLHWCKIHGWHGPECEYKCPDCDLKSFEQKGQDDARCR
jgi:hypothetical protein